MGKKWMPIIVLTLFVLHDVSAQQRVINNVGLFAGGSYYFGDINPEKMFYALSPSFGGFYRLTLNKRYAIRISLYYGRLRADDKDFGYSFAPIRNASFQSTFLDMAIQFEFNFLPYSTDPRKMIFTPYVAGGPGFALLLGSNGVSNEFVLPVSLGIKVNLSKRFDIGAEWGFRKTFNDRLDDWSPTTYSLIPENGKSFLHNNDWYSIVGIFASYKIFYGWGKCAAYW